MPDRETRICLFDWRSVGHHSLYMRRAAEALLPAASVALAAPDRVLEELADLPVEQHSLGAPAPEPGDGSSKAVAEREIELLRGACERLRPDHAFHLFSDRVLRWLPAAPPLGAPLTVTVFHAWDHYGDEFGEAVPPRLRVPGRFVEHKVRRWRRRPDAHTVFALDPFAAGRWAARRGATARWLPEPRVEPLVGRDELPEPEGSIFFGAFDERKGLDLFADAIALSPADLQIRIVGHCQRGYEPELKRCVERMRGAGASVVEPSPLRPSHAEAAAALAGARCAVLPYRWHPGTSRVLTEAAAVGTPVVGPSKALIGHYISSFGLGVAVDPGDPAALRDAVLRMADDPRSRERHAPGMRAFTEAMSAGRFERTLRETFGLPAADAARGPEISAERSPEWT